MVQKHQDDGGGKKITLKINDNEYSMVIEPHWTLREVIHDKLGLTGTKEMCDKGSLWFLHSDNGRQADPVLHDTGHRM
ncbi:MAG: hypothetical protein RQM92_12865 [Candidatus Syntrophopropionicum ammoniitolerans]